MNTLNVALSIIAIVVLLIGGGGVVAAPSVGDHSKHSPCSTQLNQILVL